MVASLLRGGHDCEVHDEAPKELSRLATLGATEVDAVLKELTPLLQRGPSVIKGDNC